MNDADNWILSFWVFFFLIFIVLFVFNFLPKDMEIPVVTLPIGGDRTEILLKTTVELKT